MKTFKRGATLTACFLATIPISSSALAEETGTPEIVITASRSPQAISEAGSAISVITAEDIAKSSPKTVAEVLKQVPGLDVTDNGGTGSVTAVRIRGVDTRHTLVLIDGIRVNDPSQSNGSFDFTNIVPVDIERIEVLRGPQSALYGSDAMGGVINIITRKGNGPPKATIQAEGGSYASKTLRGSVSGKTGAVSYALSANGFDTTGFSRYGYRIKRIEDNRGGWPLENDGAKGFGASAQFGVDLTDRTKLEFGGYTSGMDSQYDAAWGQFPDTPSESRTRFYNGFARLKDEAFDGKWRNSLTIYGNQTDRRNRDFSYYGGVDIFSTDLTKYRYQGDRYGAEYQSDLKLGAWGQLTFGGKIERETLESESIPVLSTWGMLTPTSMNAQQDTRSAFLIYQVSPIKNLHVSVSGRIDDVQDADRFGTWRAAAAYDITATGTTVRASAGTGAKAPSLYQLYDPQYGTPGLQSEHSFGFDAGIDQNLWNGRLILSATGFSNRFKDLIDFSFSPLDCPPTNMSGCFLNIGRAQTSGLELSADLELVPA